MPKFWHISLQALFYKVPVHYFPKFSEKLAFWRHCERSRSSIMMRDLREGVHASPNELAKRSPKSQLLRKLNAKAMDKHEQKFRNNSPIFAILVRTHRFFYDDQALNRLHLLFSVENFWSKLAKPIIGLAPMDGVTDAPFRYITAKYGHPDVMITEFTSVEGIAAGGIPPLRAFIYDKIERPIVAQLFGIDEKAYYKAAVMLCELGFDGIDINMGCPAKNIASKGSGASLILNPKLAQKIIKQTKKGAADWANGLNLEDVGLPENTVKHIREMQKQNLCGKSGTVGHKAAASAHAKKSPTTIRKLLPISVKTRIGYDKIVIEDWIKYLLEEKPANISLHGRTLKQMYTGLANWDAIAIAAKIVHEHNQAHAKSREFVKTTILGNGDVKSVEEAHQKAKQYGVDGVLIGRAAFGNPWIFRAPAKPKNSPSIESPAPYTPTIKEKLKVAIEHAHIHEKIFGEKLFPVMRKHLSWYCRGFTGASEVRQRLMQANNSQEVEEILTGIPEKS
ncbi:MAG: tRNA-dihydrouridine synthase [Candidatus Gracilibacteria bacterium]|jgi:tRNA-dihydrouridine synthase